MTLNPVDLRVRFRKAFRGYGAALRAKDAPPIPGEPFMSMEDAATLSANECLEIIREEMNKAQVASGDNPA